MGDAPALDEGVTSNRYTILGRLAGGGMADIFLARATSEGGVERYVVLKRVIAERSRDPYFAQMFLDEARLAAQLQHPNIAQVHDVGQLAGAFFFTMEYVHGEDVRSVLDRLAELKRPLPIDVAIHIASGALSALHHAHERRDAGGKSLGVVHRDVSPSNVMISFEGNVKLLDFGVAKAVKRSAKTQSGTVKGKISYMSPEQCTSTTVDRRSDVFSLGIVLYEMLTNERLFDRETDFLAMSAITSEDVPPPSTRRADISREIDRVVLKALARDPNRRYTTAAEMLEDLDEVASTERRIISGTGMGRFLRELFGERPEPWLALQAKHAPRITVTGKSQTAVGSSPYNISVNDTVRDVMIDKSVLEELYRTPTFDRRTYQFAVPEDAPEPVDPSEADAARPTVPLQATHADSEPPRVSRRSKIALVVIAALVVAVAPVLVVFAIKRGPDEPTQHAVIPPPVTRDPIVAPRSEPPDAPAIDTSQIAEVPTRPPTAPSPPATDWKNVLDGCRDYRADVDRTRCGIAACNSGMRSLAWTHHGKASASGRLEIEKACRERGIALTFPTRKKTVDADGLMRPDFRPTTKPPPKPAVDPCEANPLQCRK